MCARTSSPRNFAPHEFSKLVKNGHFSTFRITFHPHNFVRPSHYGRQLGVPKNFPRSRFALAMHLAAFGGSALAIRRRAATYAGAYHWRRFCQLPPAELSEAGGTRTNCRPPAERSEAGGTRTSCWSPAERNIALLSLNNHSGALRRAKTLYCRSANP